MRGKLINLFILILGISAGVAVTYIVIANPFDKTDTSGALGCQYTSCENKVIIDNTGISAAVGKVYDAVVMIENYKGNVLQGTGSGFIYKVDDKYGYIMTNQHVVEKSVSLKVKTTNTDDIEAKLLGGDEYLDVAVVRIPAKYVKAVAEIGKSGDLKLGDSVFTIGSPVGEDYFNTITSGIISGLNREITVSVNTASDWVMEVIQVDAAINPGNSGGPLSNSSGQVIGMNSLKLVDSQIEGMGFSIKIEDAMAHVSELEKGEKIERPLLGINLTNVNAASQYGIKVDSDIKEGALVISTIANSGAEKSGLEKGDIIIAIEKEKVKNAAFLKYILYKYNVGDNISVTYLRDGKEKTSKVILTKNKD